TRRYTACYSARLPHLHAVPTRRSSDLVDLGAVVVDLYTESEALGTPLMGDPRTAPFEGVAAPGDEVRASYVIRVPDDSPQIKVTVSYEAETPAVTFLGEV